MIHIYKGIDFIVSLNYSKEEFKKEWYPEWQEGMTVETTKFENPILDNGILREKTREEEILQDGKTELLQDGEYIEDGMIISVEPDEEYFKKAWDKDKHIWYEAETDIEKVEREYGEYEKLNTPRDFRKMEKEGVLDDYNQYMNECEIVLENTKEKATYLFVIPKPSEKLKEFFNKYTGGKAL